MGAIPKEIDRIAKRIGETVGRELLTPRTSPARSPPSLPRPVRRGPARRAADLLERELGALARPRHRRAGGGLEQVARPLVGQARGLEIYLASPEWEDRVRGFAAGSAASSASGPSRWC
jgi:hypothetical protein